jgi:hypothetical protein
MKGSFKILLRGISLLVCSGALAACGGVFGQTDITSPGNTPPVPPETGFRIVGTLGTPFVATVSDTRTSWTVKGSIPLSILIVNNTLPGRMVVTKLKNDSSLLSAEVITGIAVVALSSTSQPFGSAAVQAGGNVGAFPPPASPDVRFFVKGPNTGVFVGLIGDLTKGFAVEARAPAVFLFDSPNGRVSGTFSLVSTIGPFDIDLTFDGVVVDEATGGPNLTLSHG